MFLSSVVCCGALFPPRVAVHRRVARQAVAGRGAGGGRKVGWQGRQGRRGAFFICSAHKLTLSED
eukprot:4986478-Karenia_brevis.AAC.1